MGQFSNRLETLETPHWFAKNAHACTFTSKREFKGLTELDLLDVAVGVEIEVDAAVVVPVVGIFLGVAGASPGRGQVAILSKKNTPFIDGVKRGMGNVYRVSYSTRTVRGVFPSAAWKSGLDDHCVVGPSRHESRGALKKRMTNPEDHPT